MSDKMIIPLATRRSMLGVGAASAAALLGAGAKATTGKPIVFPVRFDDPVWNREAAARIQADTNGTQVYGRSTGVVCGIRPGEAVRPLLGFEVFSTIRVLRQSDGSN